MRINTRATPGDMRARVVVAIAAKLTADETLTIREAGRLVAAETGDEAKASRWAPATCNYLVQFVATVTAELMLDGADELERAGASR